jgi:hypothetical protein
MTSASNTKEWFAAIDPGKVNFAFIIEEVDKDMITKLVCPAKRDRFIKSEKGRGRGQDEPTAPYINFLEQFYHCGKTIMCSNNDITKDFVEEKEEKKPRRKKGDPLPVKESKKPGSKALDAHTFLRLTALLDRHREHFDKCSTIIIEQQMSFGSKINTMAIKIAQHAYSYFLFRYGAEKKIIEFPSYNKTQILGAPGGLEKPARKKWAISKADEIWALRGDIETCAMVGSKKKKDDMSDCLLHVLSYIIVDKYG